MEFTVEQGHGYWPATEREPMPIGVIPVDAIFTPIRRVNYHVERTRVGQVTDYDRLVLEVWTDGTITGSEAVSRGASLLVDQFTLFSQLGRPQPAIVERGLGVGAALSPDRYNTPIEQLNLSVRAYNCLKRSGLMTVGQVLEKSEDDLLALRNFGRKSYDELRAKLDPDGLPPAGAGETKRWPPATRKRRKRKKKPNRWALSAPPFSRPCARPAKTCRRRTWKKRKTRIARHRKRRKRSDIALAAAPRPSRFAAIRYETQNRR